MSILMTMVMKTMFWNSHSSCNNGGCNSSSIRTKIAIAADTCKSENFCGCSLALNSHLFISIFISSLHFMGKGNEIDRMVYIVAVKLIVKTKSNHAYMLRISNDWRASQQITTLSLFLFSPFSPTILHAYGNQGKATSFIHRYAFSFSQPKR